MSLEFDPRRARRAVRFDRGSINYIILHICYFKEISVGLYYIYILLHIAVITRRLGRYECVHNCG